MATDEGRPDLMDLALDAMERGDWEEGIRLAKESNRQLAARIEFKRRYLIAGPEVLEERDRPT